MRKMINGSLRKKKQITKQNKKHPAEKKNNKKKETETWLVSEEVKKVKQIDWYLTFQKRNWSNQIMFLVDQWANILDDLFPITLYELSWEGGCQIMQTASSAEW